jgi:glycosyltransferase involved in cell wall biosynthesis
MRFHVPSRTTRRWLRELEPDVVHIHAEFSPNNWWPPNLWSCPIILSPHGAFHSAVLGRGARRKRLYLAAARRALYARVTQFHGLSPAEQRDIASAVSSAPVYCVPQGPSPSVAALLTKSTDLETKERGGVVRFLFVGRIDVEPKGLDILIEAFARATAEMGPQSAVLTLVGPDRDAGIRRLQSLAHSLGAKERVMFHERVPQSDVPGVMRDCDVYVQLSRNEGSPLSLNDALALGKPAIVSDRVGTVSHREIRTLGHVVVVEPTVVDAARAIIESVQNRVALQRLAREAQSRVQAFLSWDRAAAQHLALYSALIPRGSVSSSRRDPGR